MPQFSELVGHDRPIRLLRRAVESGRVAHAYLFTGPPGIGKFKAACAFAGLLLCEKRGPDACGECHSCRQVALGRHPDLIQVERERDRKELRVEVIRSAERRIALKPVGNGMKVAMIRDGEEMNSAAQNCLLKTLEEPPPRTVMLLVCGNRTALHRTIISRCQTVSFEPLPLDQVAAALVSHHDCDGESARALAAFSDGSLGHALSLDRDFFTRDRARIIEALQRLAQEGYGGIQALAAELLSAESVEWSISVLLSWYRDAIRLDLLGPRAQPQNEDLIDGIGAGSWERGLRSLEDIYDTFRAVKANANKKLAMETLLLKLSQRGESC